MLSNQKLNPVRIRSIEVTGNHYAGKYFHLQSMVKLNI